jgi:hypothetical protein
MNDNFSEYSSVVDGDLTGSIYIDGFIDAPDIIAPMTISDFTAYGAKLGSGMITFALSRQPLLGRVQEEDLVFSVSTNLSGKETSSIARFALALDKRTINADADFNNLEINTAELKFFSEYFGMIGKLGGHISAEGHINSPTINANLKVQEYGFFDPTIAKGKIDIKKKYGPAIISASSKSGQLSLDLCASLLEPTKNIVCDDLSSINLSIKGPFNLEEFSLDFDGSIEHDHMEDLLFRLKKELISLDIKAKIQGKITKNKNQSTTFNAKVRLKKLLAGMPTIPSIKLHEPVSFTITKQEIKLFNDAVLLFSPGQLTINGSYSSDDVDLRLQGVIPLNLSRFFIPIIQSADGLARGNISLSGPLSSILIDGDIILEPGSSLILNRWMEPIEIKDGSISFEKTSNNSFITKLENIKLAVGDGKLSMKGKIDKHYGAEKAPMTSSFDLEAQGSNIILRDRLNFIETDFDIKTVPQKNGEPLISGNVIITDGSAHRQFDLRNFVAQAKTDAKSEIFKFFDNLLMDIDLDIAVRQFRASARMLSLDIESLLRGHLTVKGPISYPKFKGSLFVSEGAIIFPSLSFDLVESQIVLNENSKKIFDPQIEIVTTQEMEKELFPISQDTTIELSLLGDLEQLNLELRSLRGENLSQLRIFLLLLSPTGFARFDSGDLKQGAQKAAMALTGEVFLRPLTNELQELLEDKTKTRIQFGSALEPGGITLKLNWKLGPRIEIQGSYMLLSDKVRRDDADRLVAEKIPLADIKLKLLLFDHRPLGPLFLESSFGAMRQIEEDYDEPRGKIRLRYRVLSK